VASALEVEDPKRQKALEYKPQHAEMLGGDWAKLK
jgi:hypothetical protein